MATLRQKITAQRMIANGGSMAEALRKANYSHSIVRNPQRVVKSKGFAQILEEAGLTTSLLSARYKELVNSNQLERIAFPHRLEHKKKLIKDDDTGEILREETYIKYLPITDKMIKEAIAKIVGAKLINIQDSQTEKVALIVTPLHQARKGGLELISKIRGDFAPETLTVSHEMTTEERQLLESIYGKNK